MRRTSVQAGASGPSTPLAKPVFAPGVRTLSDIRSEVFIRPLSETYAETGAPQLQAGPYSDGSGNGVVQVNLAGSQMTPLIRPVFVPDLASADSLLVEGAFGERGLILLSTTDAGNGEATVQVTLAPFASVADISQGDHNGVMQVLPPTADIVSTTLTLRRNMLGDYTYLTQSSTITLSHLSPGEAANLTRVLQGRVSDLISAVAPSFVFGGDSYAVNQGKELRVTALTKERILGTLQVVGTLSTLAGGAFGISGVASESSDLSITGAVFSTVGGLCRAAAGLVTLYLPVEAADGGDGLGHKAP